MNNMTFDNDDETFTQIINELKPINKQYSSISRRINSFFKNQNINKLKENINKKIKIYDLYGIHKEKKYETNEFPYHYIDLNKIDLMIKNLSEMNKLNYIKNKDLEENNKNEEKEKNKNIKKKKKIVKLPLNINQITADPGRYNPNYNSIYKKPFFPFFRKSNVSFFDQFKKKKIKQKINLNKTTFSPLNYYRNKKQFHLNSIPNKFNKNNINKHFNKSMDDFKNNESQIKNSISNNNSSNNINKKDFFQTEKVFLKKKREKKIVLKKRKSLSLINYSKMIGRKDLTDLNQNQNDYSPKYNSILPHVRSFKMENKISFQNMKKNLLNKLIRNYNYSSDYLVMQLKKEKHL